MSEQSAIRKFLFSKAMPNGDVFYYEEEFLMDMLTGVEQSMMVKLVGVRKHGRGPILALSSNAVNNEFDELAPIGTPRQVPLSSRSAGAIATDRALSSELAAQPQVRYHVHASGKVLEIDPYYPEVQPQGEPVLHEINIGVRERGDSFASTVDDCGSNGQHCFDITASASSSLLTARDKRMLLRPLKSQSALWDDRGLDERRRHEVSYGEYFEQSADAPAWVYRTLVPDMQFRPELIEPEPFGAPPVRALTHLPLNAQANSVVTPGAGANNEAAAAEVAAAEVAAPVEVEAAAEVPVYEATGTNGYDAELAAFSGYTNYAQYYTQGGNRQGLEQVTKGRSERLTGQDSRQRYNSYTNPALQGPAAFKDFSTPQDRARSDFSSPKKATPVSPSAPGTDADFSANTMVSSSVNGVYQRQTQAQVLRPQLAHPELYERNTITTRKPGRTGPIAGSARAPETQSWGAGYADASYSGSVAIPQVQPQVQTAVPSTPAAPVGNWHEALRAARAGVPASTITPDYVAALKGARAAQFTKPRRQRSLAHLHLPAANTYMPEDPNYVPTDSAIAFADQHAAYHQACSHGHSVSRYAYGADFAAAERAEQSKRPAARPEPVAVHPTPSRDFSSEVSHDLWWRDQNFTEQSAQDAFAEESFHQGKYGAFIGTPEEFMPEEKVPQVSTVNAQIVTTSAATIVTAPAPEATVIDGTTKSGSQAGKLYSGEPETAPNDHTRIVYSRPSDADGLNGDEVAAAHEAQRAQESFNALGAVHHHPNAWDSAAQTKTTYFEDFVPGNAVSADSDFADFITADDHSQHLTRSPATDFDLKNSYDHSEQDPTHRKPKRLKNPQLPSNAVDVAAQARTSSQAQGFKPAPAVAAEVPERAPTYLETAPETPQAAPEHSTISSFQAHTSNRVYAAAQPAPSAPVQPAPAQGEVYGTYAHKAQFGDFDAYDQDAPISSAMVKGYAQQVSANTAISKGSGTGPYEPAHHGSDFTDFSTADGSKVEGTLKVPVVSQKQAAAERDTNTPAAAKALETKAPTKPTVSAAVQALAANLVANAAQEIDAEEQAAEAAKAALETSAAESKEAADSDNTQGLTKAQMKRAKRRAKSRARNGKADNAAAPATAPTENAAPATEAATTATSAVAPVAPDTPEVAPAPTAPEAAPAVSEVARAQQEQTDASLVSGIVRAAPQPAPTVNPELVAQAEHYLKHNGAEESLDLGTARDEAEELAPSELTEHAELQGLFAGVTPEDDDDVALEGLGATSFAADTELTPKSEQPTPAPAPMPTTPAKAEPSARPSKDSYSVNPITGALNKQPHNLLEGGFNEHTVVVKAEYSLESLDELHQLFASEPTAMPKTDKTEPTQGSTDRNGFSNTAYQPITEQSDKDKATEQARLALEAEEKAQAEAAEKARLEQERLAREAEEKAQAEAAERARLEQERLAREAEEKAQAEAAEKARQEQLAREAEEKAQAEAAEKARLEQERLAREAEEKAQAEAAEKARQEQLAREAEEKAQAEAAEKARQEQLAREAEEKAQAEAAEKARLEQERLAREAEEKAQAEAAEKARLEQERLAREAEARGRGKDSG